MALPQVGYKESAKTLTQPETTPCSLLYRGTSTRFRGTLSGFDRLRFVGSLLRLSYLDGLAGFLSVTSVLLKEFGNYMLGLSRRIKHASERLAEPRTASPTLAWIASLRPSGRVSRGGLVRGWGF